MPDRIPAWAMAFMILALLLALAAAALTGLTLVERLP